MVGGSLIGGGGLLVGRGRGTVGVLDRGTVCGRGGTIAGGWVRAAIGNSNVVRSRLRSEQKVGKDGRCKQEDMSGSRDKSL